MHTNHRRSGHRTKKSGRTPGWMRPYSLAWWKKDSARSWRARERHLIVNGRWDDLEGKVRKDILWNYW